MTNPLIKKEEFRWSFRKKGTEVLNICTRMLLLFGFAASAMGISTSAFANPTGGTVVGGSATISNTPTELQIKQSSQNAIINWNSFNIAAGETTHFYQPNANATALNRVFNSTQLSTINGNLLANGHIIIINPNGVIIGKGANVDTAGFIATSADIANDAFMNSTGKLNFNIAGSAIASVVNQGMITVEGEGLAALVAPTVRNDGIIQGNLSKIQLGAADTFGIDLYGDGLISLAVGSGTGKRTLTAENNGSLIAPGGKVLMTAAAASDVVDSVINNTGVVQATSLVNHNGQIILTGSGAKVIVSGKLDVSGVNGGGSIKVGGDAQGKGALAHASTTTVTSGAVLDASATDNGNGGNIIAWSDNGTSFQGTALARGGVNGGNGGNVETSSPINLNVAGITVNTQAPNGSMGTWLLDPTDVTVVGSGATGSDINVADLNNSWSNILLQADNSITFAANVNLGHPGVSLTATAGTATSSNYDVAMNGLKVGTGYITLSNQYIRTNGGSVTLQSGNSINISGSTLYTRGGAVNLTSPGVSVSNSSIGTGGGAVNVTAIYYDSVQTGGGYWVYYNCGFLCGWNSYYVPPTYTTYYGGQSSFNQVKINTSGGNTNTSGITLTQDYGMFGSTSLSSFGTNNTFETIGPAGTISISAYNLGLPNNSNNCFSAGGTTCGVSDPVAQTNLTITADDQTKTYGDLFTFDGTFADFNVTGHLVQGDYFTGATATLASAGAAATANASATPYAITVSNLTGGNLGFGNYNITYVNGSLTVNKAPLSISALTDTKTYDGTTGSTLTPAVSGLRNADTVVATEAFASKDALGTNGSTLNVDTYMINGGIGNNYTVTLNSALGTINPAALTIAAVTDSKTYDGTTSSTQTPTVSGLFGNDTVTGLNGQSFTSKDVLGAGNSTLVVNGGYTVNDGNNGNDYTVNATTASGTITPKALTVTATGADKTYDGTTADNATLNTLSGVIGNDNVTDSYAAANFTDPNVGSGKTVNVTGISLGGTAAADYSVNSTAATTANITAATLTINATTDTKTYDGTTTSSAVATETGLVAADANNLTIGAESFDSADAGARTLSVGYTLTDPGNYNIHINTAAGTINQAPLTVTANNDSKTYDGLAYSGDSKGVTYSGFVNSETASVLGGTLSYTGNSQGAVNASATPYTITPQGLTSGNYKITDASGTLTIGQATLTLEATTDSKTYDTTTASKATPVAIGLQGTDTVTNGTEVFDSANAGPRNLLVNNNGYTINDGNNGNNYFVVYQSAPGFISPAGLTIAAATETKTYDGTTTATATPTVIGLLGNDTISLKGESFGSKDVLGAGNSTLSVNGFTISDGNNGNNYIPNVVTASGTINPAPLTIAAVTDTKVYDGTTSSTQTPAVSGLFGNDTVTGLNGQSFTSKNVLGADNSTLTVNGGYTVNDGNNGNDYTVNATTASGTITPAPLTIEAVSDTKQYDSTTNSSATPLVIGLQGSDTVTGLTESFGSKNAGTSLMTINNGYTINDGNGGNDYTVNTTVPGLGFPGISPLNLGFPGLGFPGFGSPAFGVITPAPLTIAAVYDTKQYDGTTNASATPLVTGLQGSDTVTGLTESYGSKNAGTSIMTVNSGYTINDGNGGNNYTVNAIGFPGIGFLFGLPGFGLPTFGVITQAPLTVSIIGNPTKPYDGTNSATLTSANYSLAGFVGSENATVTQTVGTYNSPNVVNANTVTANLTGDNIVASGSTLLSNYTLPTSANGAGAITPVALTAAITTNPTKPYDGTAMATLAPTDYSLTGFVGGENATVTQTVGTYNSPNVVNANTVTANLTGDNIVASGSTLLSNYTLPASASGAGAITPATLTITAASANKTYDGTTASTAVATETGLAAADAGNLTIGPEVYNSRNAGWRLLSVTGYTLTDNGNYNVHVNSSEGYISQASLTIDATGDTKTYDGTTASKAVATETGLISGDTLTIGPEVFDSKNPGVRTLSVTGYTLNDGTGYVYPLGGTSHIKFFECDGECEGTGGNYNVTVNTAPGRINPPSIFSSDVEFDSLGQRPIVSVADKAINFYPSFEPHETKTLDVDVSLKGQGGNSLANIEPAAGGDGGRNPGDLANIEPAAGGNNNNKPANGNLACADAFLEGKGCAAQ